MGLWGFDTEIEGLLKQHLDCVEQAIAKFAEGMETWMEEGDLEEARKLTQHTRDLESEADDIRRSVEKKLIEGALLAHSRAEIMGLVNGVDKLANAAEAAMDFSVLQKVRVSDELKPLAMKIVEETQEIFENVRKAVLSLLEGNQQEALKATKAIDIGESDVDRLEREFIDKLFDSGADLSAKILIRQNLEKMVEVSDRAEDLSDHLETMLATRKT